MKRIILLGSIVFALLQFQSCKLKDGEPGPAGESSLMKNGNFSGTLHYNYANGDTAIIPFNYEYYASETENVYYVDTLNNTYGFSLNRRTAKESQSNVKVEMLYGTLDNLNKPIEPNFSNYSFNYSIAQLTGNKLFNFNTNTYLYYSNAIITNYNFDINTGKLTLTYSIDIDPNDISWYTLYDGATKAKLVGTLNVTLVNDPTLKYKAQQAL